MLESPDTNWTEAMEACNSVGPHLPYVETKEENEFLVELSRNVNRGQYGIWLGASDRALEGLWTCEPLHKAIGSEGFLGWIPSQPDNAIMLQEMNTVSIYGHTLERHFL